MINTSSGTQGEWRRRKCIYAATLDRDQTTRTCAEKMWCNCDATVPSRFVQSSVCQSCVLFCSLRISGPGLQFCGYGWLKHIRLCRTFTVSSRITAQALSAGPSPLIYISINQITTFLCIDICSYLIMQSPFTSQCLLTYKKSNIYRIAEKFKPQLSPSYFVSKESYFCVFF